MEDKLKRLMIEFCKRFKLKFILKFSKSLTQEEINALNLLGSGELGEALNDHRNDYSKINKDINRKLKRMGGTGNIESSIVKRLGSILTSTNKKNKITNYLKHKKKLFNLLESARKKIINENLVGTIPIPQSEGPLAILRRREKLTMMIHECIHYILEKNGINFAGRGLSPLDEGFCVFLHFRFNKYVGFYKTDKSPLTIKYRLWASFFEEFFKNTPDNEIISSIKKFSNRDLLKMMKKFLKEKS